MQRSLMRAVKNPARQGIEGTRAVRASSSTAHANRAGERERMRQRTNQRERGRGESVARRRTARTQRLRGSRRTACRESAATPCRSAASRGRTNGNACLLGHTSGSRSLACRRVVRRARSRYYSQRTCCTLISRQIQISHQRRTADKADCDAVMTRSAGAA